MGVLHPILPTSHQSSNIMNMISLLDSSAIFIESIIFIIVVKSKQNNYSIYSGDNHNIYSGDNYIIYSGDNYSIYSGDNYSIYSGDNHNIHRCVNPG